MAEDIGAASELLIRAADAGPTYLSWTWMVEPFTPYAARLDKEILDEALTRLDEALPSARGSEEGDDTVARALQDGAFATIDGEVALARRLTEAVLPTELRHQLRERLDTGNPLRLRLTPSPRLARIPWEVLMLDGERRLIEALEIRYDPPATVYAHRSQSPDPWSSVRERPPLFVIDPLLPPRAAAHGLRQVLDGAGGQTPFNEHIDMLCAQGAALYADEDVVAPIGAMVTRQLLSEALTTIPRSRLFYFGHVSSIPDEPGSASFHLYDTAASSWGLAVPLSGVGAEGFSAPHDDDHRPLAALDLLRGTSLNVDETLRARYGVPHSMPGHQLWPMPSRVAIIACEGGADYRSVETFGLVIAILNAGAELVTTTRWTLPTDHAFHKVTGRTVCPTSDLALQVDTAHNIDDPVTELAQWQRTRLQAWRDGEGISASPLVWASITHTFAPTRE